MEPLDQRQPEGAATTQEPGSRSLIEKWAAADDRHQQLDV
jgi:hypothetical protein